MTTFQTEEASSIVTGGYDRTRRESQEFNGCLPAARQDADGRRAAGTKKAIADEMEFRSQ
jgi:hypothetical protein